MKKYLELMGVGPLYVTLITLCTVGYFILDSKEILYFPVSGIFNLIFLGAVIFFLGFGVFLWIQGAVKSNLQKSIKANQLLTTGIYGVVRNPIYTAFMFVEWGILMLTGNLFVLTAIPLYWVMMTILLKYTEERWLLKQYGAEYKRYCRKVNRCFPIVKRKK